MQKIIKVGDGAYFVPSYSEQTVLLFQEDIYTQSVIGSPEETIVDEAKEAERILTRDDFFRALEKATKPSPPDSEKS